MHTLLELLELLGSIALAVAFIFLGLYFVKLTRVPEVLVIAVIFFSLPTICLGILKLSFVKYRDIPILGLVLCAFCVCTGIVLLGAILVFSPKS